MSNQPNNQPAPGQAPGLANLGDQVAAERARRAAERMQPPSPAHPAEQERQNLRDRKVR